MGLEIKFFSLLKLELKESGVEYDLDGLTTIEDLIARLDQDYEGIFSEKLLEDGQIKMGTIILVNGTNVLHLDKLETEVSEDDEVSIFPPSGGG
ncbi:MoaD family protein [Natroniella sulfidigena]|uniref:MoaD family protein n=1 Tax=Natroniella sulfidigena TaxID=723921 RepID=UPI00200A8E8F|nr:MoaD family protein [Natroniella sulfidigena]MCK8816798.1 MoaD family protein [Natroniella sulfidigena]